MANLILLLQEYGVLIVFGIVLVEQIGLPIPAFPILIVAGAMSVDGDTHWPAVLGVAMAACLISDYFWFRAGRYYGKRILKLLCKISLSPDYCVSQTEDNFNRWGPKALIVAKFIPGFNTIAPPLAGAMGTRTGVFLGFSVLGGLVWSGAGIAIGAFFHTSVDQVLDILSTMGTTALIVLGVLLALFVAFKYVERKRFRQSVEIERITIDDFKKMLEQGKQPVLIDARSATAQMLDPAVPGALLFNGGDPTTEITGLDKGSHIIVYCSCPNDVTAAHVAKTLISQGYHRARPLHGGLEAWNAAFRAPGEPLAEAETRAPA
ncbi:membrane protein DedA with SNARE-associated domain/rhodanese-related sulfurtransferase [Duganella sp. SG902]|uniref:VTT domain-containing protein n=1 Tax=Duganella sp. SG902 TaxID=2587016 RepID=UPI00159E5591|nr:VTT domain-containing protein [Duganella sp. SG902]NVM76435.1 membrane protein DedA with SNARE-associated domain/rhodanese-related sulfurtransferase [Duganella sp. SG902]